MYYMRLAPRPTMGEPWPYPKERTVHDSIFIVNPDLQFNLPPNPCDILIKLIERFQKDVYKYLKVLQEPGVVGDTIVRKTDTIHALSINTSCTDGTYPNMDMVESCEYSLWLYVLFQTSRPIQYLVWENFAWEISDIAFPSIYQSG